MFYWFITVIKMNKIVSIIAIIAVVGIVAFAYISLNTQDTEIEIAVASPVQNGDNITVLLKNNYRNVFPDQLIDVKILDDSGWAHKYTVTTDENGYASVQLEGFENGNYTVHATFNGTMFLKDSRSSASFTIDDGYSY